MSAERDWTLYCLLPGERAKIAAYQGGLDPITLEPLTKTANLDHDHETGQIRGLLNWRTNKVLQFFEGLRDREGFGRISKYLLDFPANAAIGPRYGVIGRTTRKSANRRYGPLGTKEPQYTKEQLNEMVGRLHA